MTQISSANIRLGADIRELLDGLRQASAAAKTAVFDINNGLAGSFKQADNAQKAFRGGINRLASDLAGLGTQMTKFATLPGLIGEAKAFKDFADIERLEIGLNRYKESLEGVREIAKLPNIGVFDGAKTLIGLRAVGVESEKATRLIKAFANSITEAGGNALDLEPALINIKQFLATDHINQVDLRQLANRIPQINQALRDAFGTNDTEALNKIGVTKVVEGILTELEKIPPVAGGAGTALEQAGDSLTFLSASIGKALDESLGITDAIRGLGSTFDNLSTYIKDLDPNIRRAVITMGTFAVGIGPVLVGVGGLVRLLPLLAAGFSTITWPVIAIGAVAAGIAALASSVPTATDRLAELNQQQSQIGEFTKNLDPLIKKYNDLKGQATLTSEQQKELNAVTQQIAGIIPSAVTGWDSYGKAIDISTAKVKSFTAEQQKALVALQNTRRQDILGDIGRSKSRQQELAEILRTGKETRRVYSGMGYNSEQVYSLMPKELLERTKEYISLQEKDKSNRKELLGLGGQKSLLDEVSKLDQLNTARKKVSAEYQAALKSDNLAAAISAQDRSQQLDKEIKEQRGKVIPFINEWNKAKAEARQRIGTMGAAKEAIKPAGLAVDKMEAAKSVAKEGLEAEKYIKQLTNAEYELQQIDLESKFAKDQRAVKDATNSFKELVGVVANLNVEAKKGTGISLDNIYGGQDAAKFYSALSSNKANSIFSDLGKGIDSTSISRSARDYADSIGLINNATKNLEYETGRILSSVDIGKFFEQFPKKAGEAFDQYYERIAKNINALADLSGQVSQSFRAGLADLGVTVGETLGDALSGAEGPLKNLGKNIFGILGNVLSQIGTALITYSTVIEGLKVAIKSLNGYVALAAGIAAVAAGKVLTSKAKAAGGVPKFAKGGFAYGEMLAVVGDNPNARRDPEMIAPYSKVDKSIKKSIQESGGTGSGQFEQVGVKISGTDLYVILQRANKRNASLGSL
ncbi:hypothetical protein [Dyadobacter sandarakinus]|uniref:Tape measure protein n=1 Tax=Dyadobacter sandarakinus TaxID=2747268 RepID=A0ABX7I1D8_9BACT|nr:hypothetical protein [Dyadobacter sandarakinus]QRQ99719.1 hypothetical protein HWI92_01705 [Dyadobacter sandarakinus]